MALLDYALTTVARQKTFLEISGDTYDTILETLINSASEYIESYCDRRFKLTTYTSEELDGNGYNKLLLPNYPISSTESFDLDIRSGTINESNWDDVDEEQYFIKYDEGILQFAGVRVFEDLPRHYRVTYTAGYDYDNAATYLSDVGAADLEFACWKLVATSFYRRKSAGDIESESIGNYSVTFRKDMDDDPVVVDILSRYKRPAPM